MTASTRAAAPGGLRWATGGGSPIGGCNGLHLAPVDTRGTLCGRYGPADSVAHVGDRICGSCARVAGVPRVIREASRVYALPPRFYHDHVARDPEEGVSVVERETAKEVLVRMDDAAYRDLLSDARHYSEASQFGPEYRGLCSSAVATVRRLEADGPPGAEA